MSYRSTLHPWCIVRCLPNLPRVVVARLRRRTDAEAYLKCLQRLLPSATYVIVFDPNLESD
jgi:hypothetical protein